MSRTMSGASRLKSAIGLIAGSHVVAAGMATYFGNETWYRKVVMPIVHTVLDGETSHKVAVWCAKHGFVPKIKVKPHDELKTSLWGLTFENPIGLAAGFDKHGEATKGLTKVGFGFVEVGSVTPEPQPGNPTPRVFRLKEDGAIINRYGFNSVGHETAFKNLETRSKEGIVGVNLGKNKTSKDDAEDYTKGVVKFSEVADYLVINISSPNTPGLRALQGKQNLEKLLKKVMESRNSLPMEKRKPILVKLSPDLTDADKSDIADVITRPNSGVDGLIISNTTIDRSMKLVSTWKDEVGGLSGEPIKDLSTKTIKDMYLLTGGKVPIIGVGGVSSGEDAYKKMRAGASLVQLYSSLAYLGPPVVNKINKELAEILKKDGVKNVSEIVGLDAIKP